MTGKELGSQIATCHNGLMEDERKKYVDQAISELSTEDQALVSLFYVHEKDMNEIGSILNLTHANVRKRMSRVRDKLKMSLEKRLNKEIINLLG
jgi:RNA polymerase sigma-70 factor (ECF subfamily)